MKFWRAFAKAVPTSNAGFFKACYAYEKLGERAKAIDFCGTALLLPPDYLLSEADHFGKLVLGKDSLDKRDINNLEQLSAHLRQGKQPLAEFYAEKLQCDLALRVDDDARLTRCATALAKIAPGDPHTIAFQWSLAVRQHDFNGAERLIVHAKAARMTAAAIAELERGLAQARAERRTHWIQLGGGVALLVMLLAFGVRALRALLLRRQGGGQDPAPSGPVAPVS